MVLYIVYVTGKSVKNTHIAHTTSIFESDGTLLGRNPTGVKSLESPDEVMVIDVSSGLSMPTTCDDGHTLSENNDLVWGVSSTLALRLDVDISTLSNMLLIPTLLDMNPLPSFIIKQIRNRAMSVGNGQKATAVVWKI